MNLSSVERRPGAGKEIPVFIAGLPGKMATSVASAIEKQRRYALTNKAATSVRHRDENQLIGDSNVHLINYYPTGYPPLTIAVDYSTSGTADMNARHYMHRRVPFVMGASLCDISHEELQALARERNVNAVISPNMAPEVVRLQAELETVRKIDPDRYRGWRFRIRESHQAGKREASATAAALQAQLEALGAKMDGEIVRIRRSIVQRAAGIQNLDAHAYHWIDLFGPGSAEWHYRTAVEGREPYVEGTMLALDFLAKKNAEQREKDLRGRIFSMIDVLADQPMHPPVSP